jgi:pimeloyl-ACP methyl ester carboxylesterase
MRTMLTVLCLLFTTALSSEERLIQKGPIKIWTESFGNHQHPAILLIQGAGCQGIAWPDRFCERLAEKKYFVIRYDHRDTGLSSIIDYQKTPYNLDDLTGDAVAILDQYGIQKAHVVGLSMGGFIGQLLAIDHKERVLSLCSLMSSPDHRVLMAAVTGQDTSSFSLPPPPQIALKLWDDMKRHPSKTLEDKIETHMKSSRICSGSQGFDEEELRPLVKRMLTRTQNSAAVFNHWLAMSASPDRTERLKGVRTRTLVIHGGSDIVLPVEHGKATAKAIPGSKLVIIPEMGHVVCSFYFDRLLSLLTAHFEGP